MTYYLAFKMWLHGNLDYRMCVHLIKRFTMYSLDGSIIYPKV